MSYYGQAKPVFFLLLFEFVSKHLLIGLYKIVIKKNTLRIKHFPPNSIMQLTGEKCTFKDQLLASEKNIPEIIFIPWWRKLSMAISRRKHHVHRGTIYPFSILSVPLCTMFVTAEWTDFMEPDPPVKSSQFVYVWKGNTCTATIL